MKSNESFQHTVSVVNSLKTYKGTHSACLLLLLIDIEGLWGTRITKVKCRELLGSSPTQALAILKQSNAIDFMEWRLLEPTYETLAQPIEEDTPITKFSWKYGKQFHTNFGSYWNLLINFASSRRYEVEEYFERLMVEIRKDDWWRNVITEEMALRKIEFLENKFWNRIPNKVQWLSSISHIF